MKRKAPGLAASALRSKAPLLLAMACVGAGFVVVIRAGFWLAGQKAPSEIVTALPVALVVLAMGAVMLARSVAGWLRHRQVMAQARRERAAAPAAPPWQPPDAAGLCLHLAPVESAMGAAGVPLRMQHGHHLADCCIDRANLVGRFGHAVADLYGERHEIDRSIHDPKTALLYCPPCDSSLTVIHPEQAGAQTLWFPAPTAGDA